MIEAPTDAHYLGAKRRSNNTGELCAFVESLLWIHEEAPVEIRTSAAKRESLSVGFFTVGKPNNRGLAGGKGDASRTGRQFTQALGVFVSRRVSDFRCMGAGAFGSAGERLG